MEIWKSIEGTNGRLEVSNRGRVKSNLRDGRILKQQTDNKGYKRVRVTLDGVKRGYKVHRLVATAFVPNPNGLPQVNHIDGNKDNNDVANLEWVSCRDNIKHAYENGLFKSVIEGVQKENAKRMKAIKATNIETGEVTSFRCIADAERLLGTRHITDVLKGKRNSAKGYTFEYQKEVI